MIIDVKKQFSKDLFVENASLLLGPQRIEQQLDSNPPLGAVTFVAERTNLSLSLRDLAVACGREAIFSARSTLDQSYKLWIFIADGPWRPATKTALHQKLWKNHQDLILACGGGHRSDEVAIKVGGQVRHAGLLEITDEMFDKAIDFARTFFSCAIIFSKNDAILSQNSITSLFDYSFPKQNGFEQTSVNWLTLAVALCPQDDVIIRVSGLFDDREAAVDLIATPHNLPAM